MQNLIYFYLVYSLLTDAFILCFSGPKSKKVISNLKLVGFSKNMAAIKQHALVEKEQMEVFFPFFFPLFMFWLEFNAYGDAPHVL